MTSNNSMKLINKALSAAVILTRKGKKDTIVVTMTQQKQFLKNIDLSEKLANYIAQNPDAVKNFSKNASFVTFSSTDNVLNAENKKLLKSLLQEGREVIKAQETTDIATPWRFSTSTPLL